MVLKNSSMVHRRTYQPMTSFATQQVEAPDRTPVLPGAPLPRPVGVPASLADLGPVDLVLVKRRADRATWNGLIACEHPQGLTTFAGCRLRYLVHAPGFGHLGAVGFAAAALKLAARQRWMAWSPAQRSANLERVIGLSRFLIRPLEEEARQARKPPTRAEESPSTAWPRDPHGTIVLPTEKPLG